MDDADTERSFRVVETLTLTIMWILCLIGNVLVCVVIHRSRRLQSTTNYFIIALAALDLVYAFLVVPFLMAWIVLQKWIFGTVMCKVIRYVQFWLPATTTFIMVAITIDRFYTILYPLSFKISRNKSKQMIVVAVSLGAVFALPVFYLFGRESKQCELYAGKSWHGIAFLCLSNFVCFTIPVIAMNFGLCQIGCHIWQLSFRNCTVKRTANPVPGAKVKAMKMLILLLTSTSLLLGCFHFVQLLEWILSQNGERERRVTLYVVMTWVVCFSTVSKPTVYFVCNSNFRRGCQEVCCMSAMKCYRTNAYTITTASKFGKKNHVGVSAANAGDNKTDSPSKAFNRSLKVESSAWPLGNPSDPSTTL